jgi:hypothetical protein
VRHEQPAPSRAEPGESPAGKGDFDIASLPPIDSITANSDIRAFLQSGVPADLAKAALRRAWTEDPAIRNFIGIAENQWDFTDPTAIPGFGPLQPGDSVQDLVAQAMGRVEKSSSAPSETAALTDAASPSDAQTGEVQLPSKEPVQERVVTGDEIEESGKVSDRSTSAAAPQHELRAMEIKGRKHGRALPKSS